MSASPRRRARIGLVGLGRMGRVHAASLAERCPSAELVGVVDERADLARRLADELGVEHFRSVEDLLGCPGLDGVVLATPTASHAPLAIAAARAGRHVFTEKPISLEREATVAAIEAAAGAGVVLQVGFHRRFDPDFVAAAERVRSGELGDVYLFRASLRDMTPPRPEFLSGSGGFFLDMSIHDLDAARWLVGEVDEVAAYGASLSDPAFGELGDFDNAIVVLRFASGALGVIDNSRCAGYGYECSLELLGSRATVRVVNPWRHGYEWREPGAASHPLVETFEERYPVAYAAELEGFARSILDGSPPRAAGADGLAAFDLARAAGESCRLGRPVRVAAVAG